MNLLQGAAAVSIVSGVAAREGWPHAVGAAALLLAAMAVWRIIRDGPRVRAANGSALVTRRDQRVAEWVITSYAAIFRSEEARGIALEASQSLDEMVGDGAGWRRVLMHAAAFLLRMPVQLPRRAAAAPPPVLSAPPRKSVQSGPDDADDEVASFHKKVTRSLVWERLGLGASMIGMIGALVEALRNGRHVELLVSAGVTFVLVVTMEMMLESRRRTRRLRARRPKR